MTTSKYLVVYILVTMTTSVVCNIIDGVILGERIQALVNDDGMGYSKLQDFYDKDADLFDTFQINGSELVDQFAESMGDKFGAALDAVRNIKLTVEEEYEQFSTSYQGFGVCCRVSDADFEKNAYLNKKVNWNDACVRIGGNAVNSPTIPITEKVFKAYRENYDNNPKIYWQYFGTEEGVFATFPSRGTSSCSEYDPRFRPWYVETTIPTPKDVVIVLDRSQSMGNKNIMGLAKEAAQTVLGTLNPNDRMGLVYFSHKAFTPTVPGKHSCFSSELAYATPENKNALKEFIGTITTQKNTMYKAAFQEAFRLLTSGSAAASDRRARDKAIVFLTDGKPDESHDTVLQYLESQAYLGVKILTYGIGEEVSTGSAATLLQQMANERYGNGGVYTHIEDASNLRYKMGLYYNAFVSNRTADEVVITAPYVDYSGLGLVISMCMPVHHQGQLKGVTCIDFNVIQLIEDVAFFSQDTSSYAFVIDGAGRVMLHPLITPPADIPRDSWERDPVFIDVYTLEKSSTRPVVESMKSGESGTLDLETTIVAPRGDVKTNGVTSYDATATYTWKNIPNTNFSICVVVVKSEQNLKYVHDERSISKRFIYHRLNLNPSISTCSHMGRLCTIDGPSVKFTPSAFKEPLSYIYDEDVDIAKRYKWYMEGSDTVGDVFKDGFGLRTILSLTQQIQTHWENEYKEHVIWMYVGLEMSAFLIYPGVSFDYRFDHTKRSWYRQAMDNTGSNVISAPYNDAGLTGIIMTISRTLYQGRSGKVHSQSDPVVGVIGMDMKLETLRSIIQEVFPDCNGSQYSCFMADTSGFLVYHEDFFNLGEHVENVHVILKEPSISIDLIDKGFLLRKQCDDFESKISFHTWELSIPGGVVENLGDIPSYQAEIVQNTNTYLFIRSTGKTIPSKTCHCELDSSIVQCTYEDLNSCECPCTTIAEFYYCLNTFPYTTDSPDLCYPSAPSLNFSSPIPNEQDLMSSSQLCFQTNCSIKSDIDCRTSSLCHLCSDDTCAPAYTCPVTTEMPTTIDIATTESDELADEEKSNILVIAMGTIAGAILLAIIIVVVVIAKKRRPDHNRSDDPVIFSPSSSSSVRASSLFGPANPPPSVNNFGDPLPDLQNHTPTPRRHHHGINDDVYLNPDDIPRRSNFVADT